MTEHAIVAAAGSAGPRPRRHTTTISGCPGKASRVGVLAPPLPLSENTVIAQRKIRLRHPQADQLHFQGLSPPIRRGFRCDLTGTRTEGILR